MPRPEKQSINSISQACKELKPWTSTGFLVVYTWACYLLKVLIKGIGVLPPRNLQVILILGQLIPGER